ncbi:lipoprotein BUG3 [Streptococcus iniae]|uniref:lipoprotein BUG3 n=1 Tax=Streptococcus iniae TaxID=1346 RepID=UPI0008D9ECFD|nr:lipoprotein BUG3 [Streptococcus iniae]OHX28310.1 lipoprotein BUG3 [Streptococcus iniae]RLV27088.1 lipoprotein BUG3 [Streptococcus iniae]
MYKRLKCVLPIVFLGIILVGCQMNSEQKSQKNETKTSKHVSHQKKTKKQQLAYLKEHEQEIIDFVKSQSKKVESVQIDWEDVRWGKASFLSETEYYISIYGRFNKITNSSFGVDIYLTEDNKVDLESIGLGQQLRVGGKIFE